MGHYLHAYFGRRASLSGDDQSIKFALSDDGLFFRDVADGRPILEPVLGERAVRDPYLLRREPGDGSGRPRYVMLGTDLDFWNPRYAAADGGVDWGATVRRGSAGICVWESENLADWSAERIVDVASSVGAGNVWAPRAIWVPAERRYLVYWASCTPDDDYAKQRIWAAWTLDFVDFSKPFVYMEKPFSVIDAAIFPWRGRYLRFTKNEEEKFVFLEVSDSILGEFEHVPQVELESHRGGYEGPDAHVLPDGRLMLFMDEYVDERRGYIAFVSDDPLAPDSFHAMPADEYRVVPGGNHGTVLPISAAEASLLGAL